MLRKYLSHIHQNTLKENIHDAEYSKIDSLSFRMGNMYRLLDHCSRNGSITKRL